MLDNIQYALSKKFFTVYLGDLNFNYMYISDDFKSNAHIIECLCQMKQLISEPTRVTPLSASTIDLIYTSEESFHIKSGIFKTCFSDHYAVFTIIRLKQYHSPGNTIIRRNYSDLDTESYLNDLYTSPVFNIDDCISECNNEIDLECLWKKWIVEFKRISNIHAPSLASYPCKKS